MRKERVHASDSLLRILSVHFILRFAILFWNGEDAQGRNGLERVGGLRTEHAKTKIKIIGAIHYGGTTGDK